VRPTPSPHSPAPYFLLDRASAHSLLSPPDITLIKALPFDSVVRQSAILAYESVARRYRCL
jgi:hypothetical protein